MAEEMIHECDNCDWSGTEDELGRQLFEMPDLLDRIDPGCPVPSGDCPECQGCCYPLDKAELERRAFPKLVTHLQCALDYYRMFRDKSPLGPTEQDDIAACQAVLDEVAKLQGG